MLKNKFIVYKIYCKANNKSYIGITENFKRRFAVHWHDAKRGRATVLCRNIRKYGKDNFIIAKLNHVDSWEEACRKEKSYIKFFNTKVPNGLNMTDGGDGVYGINHTKETRLKMSESHKGKHEGEKNHRFGKLEQC